MNLITIEGWETPATSTDNATLCAEDEQRRTFWDIFSSDTVDSKKPEPQSLTSSPSFTPPPPRRKKNRARGCLFLKRGIAASHVQGIRPALLVRKTP